jgi:hypothetical protein
LDDLGLAQLYHASWAPEMARAQRLRRELADYSALVVSAGAGGRRHTGAPVRTEDLTRGRREPDLLQ